MKKIIRIITVLVFSATLLVSCDDQLSLDPETSFTGEQLYSSAESLESLLNGMWSVYLEGDYHGLAYHQLLAPHSGLFTHKRGPNTDDVSKMEIQTNNKSLIAYWKGTYKTINIANTIISNLDESTIIVDNKDTSLGQAYFLRGLIYFELAQLFGDVPLRLTAVTSETIHLARTSKTLVYESIISDLKKAAELLPDRGEYKKFERPLKYAANMTLAKVYMRLAGEDGGDASYWQMAYDEAIKVYGQYSLVPSYERLFLPDGYPSGSIGDIENSGESILELQYGFTGADRHNDLARTYTPSNYYLYPPAIRTFGRILVNKETFDHHAEQYPNDPRIDATYLYNGFDRNGGKKALKIYPKQKKGNNAFTWIKKYEDPSYNGTTSERNIIKLRYADLLLMLAELENELNGPANAYTYVNEVLLRARNTVDGATEPADWNGMTQDEFRLRIMMERRYELLGEGLDWFDTHRRGYQYFLTEVIQKHNNHKTLEVHVKRDVLYPENENTTMLMPIPLSEMSTNQEISQEDQNPGY